MQEQSYTNLQTRMKTRCKTGERKRKKQTFFLASHACEAVSQSILFSKKSSKFQHFNKRFPYLSGRQKILFIVSIEFYLLSL